MFRLIATTLLVALVAGQTYPADSRTYSFGDPLTWENTFPKCGGERQSPINIKKERAYSDRDNLPDLTIKNQLAVTGSVINDGRVLTFKVKDNTPATEITDGPLGTEVYKLDMIEFYMEKSLHKRRGDRKRAEISLIFKNKNKQAFNANVYNEACFVVGDCPMQPVEVEDMVHGIAIISAFVKTGKRNDALATVIDQFPAVMSTGNIGVLSPEITIDVADFLPNNIEKRFYTYKGSFTRPPCNEGVTWIIPSGSVKAKSGQIKAFRDIEDIDGEVRNKDSKYRDTQDRNWRVVGKSFGSNGKDKGDKAKLPLKF